MFKLQINFAVICLAVTVANATTNSLAGKTGKALIARLQFGDPLIGNFERIGSKLYFISDFKLNWFDAFTYCRTIDSDLLNIETSSDHSAISYNLLAKGKRGNDIYWIDMNDQSVPFQFVSFTTGRRSSFFRWSAGEPNNLRGQEGCVFLWFREGEFKMNDSICHIPQFFICQARNEKRI